MINKKPLLKMATIVLFSLSSYTYADNNKISSVVTFKAVAIKDSFNNTEFKNQQSPLQLNSQIRTENKEYLLFENNTIVKKVTLPTKIKTDDYYWSDH